MFKQILLGGGGAPHFPSMQKGGQGLRLVPIELPKGGSRWFNTPRGGVIYG